MNLVMQQEKNVSSDTLTTNRLKVTLATMISDPAKREQVERRIQSATNRSTFRTNKPRQPARKRQSVDNDFDLLKVKMNELTTLMYFSNLKIKEELHCFQLSVLLNLLELTLHDPTLNVKSYHLCAKQIKISAPT